MNKDLTRGCDSDRIGCLQPKHCEVRPSFISLACISLPRFSHSCLPQSGFLDHRLHRTRSSVTKQASRRQATKLLGMIDGQCANAGHWHPRRLNSLPSTLARLIRNFCDLNWRVAHFWTGRCEYPILLHNSDEKCHRRIGWPGVTPRHCLLHSWLCEMSGCQRVTGYA